MEVQFYIKKEENRLLANSISSCTKLDIYEGLLLAYNKGAIFLLGTEESIPVCNINEVSAKTMAVDDTTGKKEFGGDDQQ